MQNEVGVEYALQHADVEHVPCMTHSLFRTAAVEVPLANTLTALQVHCQQTQLHTFCIIVGRDGVSELHLQPMHAAGVIPTVLAGKLSAAKLAAKLRWQGSNQVGPFRSWCPQRTTSSYCDWSIPLSSKRCVRSSLRKSMRSWYAAHMNQSWPGVLLPTNPVHSCAYARAGAHLQLCPLM